MFNNFHVLQAEQFSDSESCVVCLSRQMNVQRDEVVVGYPAVTTIVSPSMSALMP